MSRAYSTVAHDYGKPLIAACSYRNSAAGSLSDVIPPGTTVVINVTPRAGGTALVNRAPATIVTSTGGTVTLRYDWTAPQLANPGSYAATFEAAATGGAITLPTVGFIPVTIRPDLG